MVAEVLNVSDPLPNWLLTRLPGGIYSKGAGLPPRSLSTPSYLSVPAVAHIQVLARSRVTVQFLPTPIVSVG